MVRTLRSACRLGSAVASPWAVLALSIAPLAGAEPGDGGLRLAWPLVLLALAGYVVLSGILLRLWLRRSVPPTPAPAPTPAAAPTRATPPDPVTEVLMRRGLRAARIGTWEWNVANDRVVWSDGVDAMFGMAPGEFGGTVAAYLALVHPDDRERVRAALGRLVDAGIDHDLEYRVCWPDGQVRWLVGKREVIRDDAGAIQRVVGMVMDVTERRRAEHELRRNEERYRSVVAALHEGVVVQEADSTIVACNHSAESILGLTADQMRGRTSLDPRWRAIREDGSPFPGEVHPSVIAMSTGKPQFSVIMGVHKPDASLTWISINAVPLLSAGETKAKGVVASFVDITDRRRAELAMRESEERLRALAENMPGIISMIDRTGTILYINRVLTGYDRAAVLGTNTYAYLKPEYVDAYRATVERVFDSGESADIELEGSGAKGETAWYFSRLAPIRSAGRTIAAVVATHDITDRKRAEAERRSFQREREALLERLQMQMDRNPIGCIVWDAECRYHYVNPAAERIFGYTCAEMVGRPARLICAEHLWPAIDEVFKRLAGGDMAANSVNENVTKDGRTIICEWHNTPMFDAAGGYVGAMSMVQDVSARRQLEDQYRQAQKMEAIGKLAGGVAHDFNNLLTAIMGYGEMLLARRGLDEVAQGHVRQITKAGRRAAALTQQLLAYSRKQVLQPRVVNLNLVVAEMDGLLRRLIGEHIELRTELDTRLWQVRADPNQFEQVIMNLAVNARDAMAAGGALTISTGNLSLDESAARSRPDARPGEYVRIRVQDTGEGMTAEVMERIFEPFFTTKKAGEGTGLGLSMVFGVVKQSGGTIGVSSRIGQGTAFEILLPRCDDGEAPAPRRREHSVPVMGTETVLVVEDDDDVRALVRETLATSGYQVLEASDGQSALELSESFPRQIDLLVSDLVMPRLSGRELMTQLRRQRPAIAVLLMSGYVDDAALAEFTPQPGIAFLEKPFTAPALLGKVRQVLGQAAAR